MSTALHILVSHQNMVGSAIVLILHENTSIDYYLESNGGAADMETHP